MPTQRYVQATLLANQIDENLQEINRLRAQPMYVEDGLLRDYIKYLKVIKENLIARLKENHDVPEGLLQTLQNLEPVSREFLEETRSRFGPDFHFEDPNDIETIRGVRDAMRQVGQVAQNVRNKRLEDIDNLDDRTFLGGSRGNGGRFNGGGGGGGGPANGGNGGGFNGGGGGSANGSISSSPLSSAPPSSAVFSSAMVPNPNPNPNPGVEDPEVRNRKYVESRLFMYFNEATSTPQQQLLQLAEAYTVEDNNGRKLSQSVTELAGRNVRPLDPARILETSHKYRAIHWILEITPNTNTLIGSGNTCFLRTGSNDSVRAEDIQPFLKLLKDSNDIQQFYNRFFKT